MTNSVIVAMGDGRYKRFIEDAEVTLDGCVFKITMSQTPYLMLRLLTPAEIQAKLNNALASPQSRKQTSDGTSR